MIKVQAKEVIPNLVIDGWHTRTHKMPEFE